MQLIATPESITENPWMSYAYQLFGFSSHRSMLIATGGLVISLIIISNIFSAITYWAQYKYCWKAAHSLSIRLLTIYLIKPYAYFLNQNTSKLRAYLISEITGLIGGIVLPLIEATSRILVALIIFILLLFVNAKIAITMLFVLGGSYIIIYLAQQAYIKRLGEERVTSNVKRYKILEELLIGIKTVKTYQAQPFFFEEYSKASKEFCDIQPKVQLVTVLPRHALEVLAFGGILGVTMYLFIMAGNIQTILPTLTLYAVAGYRLLPALQQAFSAVTRIRHSYPALEKLHPDLVASLKYQAAIDVEEEVLPLTKQISFDQVGFSYEEGSQEALSKVSFTFKKGETVAFIGSTGSGKTTLIDILVGLLEPSTGTISIDNELLNNKNTKSWQGQIAYVPQDVFLFDDSIAKNIAIGFDKENIDYNRLIQVAKMADIHEFIVNEMSDGFETTVGERGVRVSGGQKQRLGLARALYRNPSVLILDEATSALDSITEKGIIDALDSLPKELTIILIAHRLSTVKHADQIYLLEDGFLKAKGNYDELLNSNETFKTMVHLS